MKGKENFVIIPGCNWAFFHVSFYCVTCCSCPKGSTSRTFVWAIFSLFCICWSHLYEYCNSNLQWPIALYIIYMYTGLCIWLCSFLTFFYFLKIDELVFKLLCCHWFTLFFGFSNAGQQTKNVKFLDDYGLQHLWNTKQQFLSIII